MSYITFQQKCRACSKIWNAAFGIVGMFQVAEAPKACPHCGSTDIFKVADGWEDSTSQGVANG